MAFEYFPAAAAAEQKPVDAPKPNWLLLTSGALFLALCFAVGYIIWDKNNSINALKASLNSAPAPGNNNLSADRDSLQLQFAEITTRYDLLKAMSVNANDTINERDKQITEKSNYIRQLLGKLNTGNAEIIQAKKMIVSLTADIESFKKTIETLKHEKIVLFEEKQAAGQQRDAVQTKLDSARTIIKQQEDIIDVATTLNASNFSIISINERNNGSERSTIIAKQVDKLRISFDVGENHITNSGIKELYVCITGPDGTPISVEALGSGKFSDRDGRDKFYTQKIDINYTQGSSQTVSFDWRQNRKFEPGIYKIEVFNNGFRIGGGTRFLKR